MKDSHLPGWDIAVATDLFVEAAQPIDVSTWKLVEWQNEIFTPEAASSQYRKIDTYLWTSEFVTVPEPADIGMGLTLRSLPIVEDKSVASELETGLLVGDDTDTLAFLFLRQVGQRRFAVFASSDRAVTVVGTVLRLMA